MHRRGEVVYLVREGGIESVIHRDKCLVTMLTNEALKKREGERERRRGGEEERRREKKEERRGDQHTTPLTPSAVGAGSVMTNDE